MQLRELPEVVKRWHRYPIVWFTTSLTNLLAFFRRYIITVVWPRLQWYCCLTRTKFRLNTIWKLKRIHCKVSNRSHCINSVKKTEESNSSASSFSGVSWTTSYNPLWVPVRYSSTLWLSFRGISSPPRSFCISWTLNLKMVFLKYFKQWHRVHLWHD